MVIVLKYALILVIIQVKRALVLKISLLGQHYQKINLWGEQLREVRKDYLSRKGVIPYLNKLPELRGNLLYPWDRYYGYPKPSKFKRLKIWLGKWRRKFLQFNSKTIGKSDIIYKQMNRINLNKFDMILRWVVGYRDSIF